MTLSDLLNKVGGFKNTVQNKLQDIGYGSAPGSPSSPVTVLKQPVQAQEPLDPEFWTQADLREANQSMAQNGGVPMDIRNSGGRNPKWDRWQQLNPKSFEELLAGARQASQNTGVPTDLLMDISGLETSGGQFVNQIGGGPGQGYFQFEPETLSDLGSNIDPYSATQSAQLAAELIKNNQLSRWGTPQAPGMRDWGTLDNPNNRNGKLVDFYSPAELNPYLSPEYQVK